MNGKIYPTVITTRVIPATREALEKFPRSELRSYARDLGVELGRNTSDTIANLLESGKATLLAQLGD